MNLSNALAQAGAHVHAYGRSLSIPGGLLSSVRWSAADFADRQALAAAIETADFVFHLAGSSTPSSANADPTTDVHANLVATLGLLERCRVRPVRRVVFVSSGGTVYGVPHSTPIPETAPTDPISAYGIHKLAIEKYLALYRHLYEVDYVILRVANPYGPMQLARRNQGVVAAFIRHILAHEPIEIWGGGTVVRDFIYIDDVVRALMMAAVYKGPFRLFNVGSGTGISVNTIVDDIERILDAGPIQRARMPARPADVPVNVLDIRLIQDEIGWSPLIRWEDGLRRTISWMTKFQGRH
jgi:UDP-glucose 4-epimerase